ncbi:MAG: VWA domain-containing protein [Acidobacteriota bacterium]|nr:VWA domain-containing protein [Acidobacteriota bacterium]
MKRTAWLVLLASVAAAFAAAARPQDAVRPTKPLQHQVSVVLKLIQVYVMDKNGSPVSDLTKDDFVLLEDGKPQNLTEFEKHSLTVPAGEPVIKPAAPTAAPPAPLLGRKFLLFFDFAFNDYFGIRKMSQAALHFLDTHVQPSDEVGVISFSALKLLEMHFPLGSDHRKIREFVAKIGPANSNQRFEDTEDEYKRMLAAGQPADARPEAKTTLPTQDVPEVDAEAMMSLTAKTYANCLTSLAWALRSVQGQKNLIFFSKGIPYPTVYPLMSQPFWEYQNMLKEMQTSNVAISALYTGGITLNDLQTGAGTLAKTSYDTGGQYWGNMYNYQPFAAKVDTLTGSYYVLGFPVSEKWDGKYHALKIEVKRPGCIVRAPGGYANPKLFRDYDDLEKLINLVDVALAASPISQAPIRFDMSAQARSTEAANNLVLAASLPWDTIRELAGRKVEVVSLAFNAADEIAQMKRTEEALPRDADGRASLLAVLSVPPGLYRCRFVIRDLETGRAAVAGVTTTVPTPLASGFKLLPPILVRPERGAFYLKAHQPDAGPDKKAGPPALKSLVGFDPAQYVLASGSALRAGSEPWAVLRCLGPEAGFPKLKITAILYDKMTGDKIPVPLAIVEESTAGAMRAFFIRMAVPDVEPDDYLLVFNADDEASGAHSEMAREFTIEKDAGKGA